MFLQPQVFPPLVDLAISFRNFKVRINAVVALASPNKREHYGSFYHSIFAGLIKALETAENIDDYNEHKHRDNLIEQICLTLGHLLLLLNTDDLNLLESCIYSDHLKRKMRSVWERVLPEKSAVLSEACAYIAKLNEDLGLTMEQKNILDCLNGILKQHL